MLMTTMVIIRFHQRNPASPPTMRKMRAQTFKAELKVLHVLEFHPGTVDPQLDPYLIDLRVQTREAIRMQLAEYVLLHIPTDLPVTYEFCEGYPAEQIEAMAAKWGADLVVLGTHGRRGLGRFLLGSVAEQTLRLARHPTLIVREHQPPGASEAGVPPIGQILCPVNYSEVAHSAFEHAAAITQRFAARLTAVFAVEEEHPTSENLRNAEEHLRNWLPAASMAQCWIQAVVRYGDAAEQVIHLARETAADLVVLGAQHRRFADTTVLGVTTERITRHAPCPVLVVPRGIEV
jgi:nucleotide-binding universal stress UspA family protein